jgi:hypothetical protein
MRNLHCILFALFIAVLLGACSDNNKKFSRNEEHPGFLVYKLFITTQQNGSGGKVITVTDSTSFEAANDSSAYLNAMVKYNGYVTNWKDSVGKNTIEPVGFKLTSANNEDIAAKLTASQKANIEIAARALVPQEKKGTPDSSNNYNNNDSDKAGPKNTLDSIKINKPAGDSTKNYRRKRPSSTYVPI